MDVEESVRTALRDDRWTLPAWPDPVSRVRTGMTRRRLRHAGAVAAVIVAVLVVTIPILVRRTTPQPPVAPSPTPTPTAVAWLDQQASTDQLGRPRLPSPRPTARPCTAADLSPTATTTDEGAASGTRFYAVQLTNVGNSTCTLAGSAEVVATDAATDARGPLELRSDDFLNPESKEFPATVAPGEKATLSLVTASGCEGGANMITYRNVVLVLPFRRYNLTGLVLETSCLLAVSPWFRFVEPYTLPPRFGQLRAGIEAPATVRAGGTLEYVVTLRSTGSPVTLDPCPGYSQMLFKSGGNYALNCAVVVIPASGVRFAMRLAVALYTPPGPQQLMWDLLDDDGTRVSALSTVEVLP
jgi:hypothetical protein